MASLDLRMGPIVVEMPPGPLIGVVNDVDGRVVMDLGMYGPDEGRGGRHVIVPPGCRRRMPFGYFEGTAHTNRVLLTLRAIQQRGDAKRAMELLRRVDVHPLVSVAGFPRVRWIDVDVQPIPEQDQHEATR